MVVKLLCALATFELNGKPSENDAVAVTEWIWTPQVLAESDRDVSTLRVTGTTSALALGARMFLCLGRLDDAEKAAKLGLLPRQTLKGNVLVDFHIILGKIAAARAQHEESAGHFDQAVEVAQQFKFKILVGLIERERADALL